jgi:predicted dehydrogenase
MLRVGIIGAGGMGNVHARHYVKMPDVELSFYEQDPERATQFQATHAAVAAKSAQELIKSVDVVDVCLPSDLHHTYGLMSIREGKATFIEKPLAKTLQQGAELVEAADIAKVALGTGQVVRYFPEFRTAHNIVKGNKIGTPAAARMRRGGTMPGKGNANWFMDHSRSGGVLIDLAIHEFDWLRWTLGEVKFLYARSLGAKSMSGPDYALTTLTVECGAVAHVESTWMDPNGFRTTFEVSGSGGMIEFDSKNTPTLRTNSNGTVTNEGPLAASDDPYFKELRAFLDAVAGGTEPPVSGFDGLKALSIAEAALESAKTDKVIIPATV